MKRPRHKPTGFAVLYAVLLTTVILTVALSLGNIIYKQIVLSSVGRGSRLAHYAANTTLECVSFWYNKGVFIFNNPSVTPDSQNVFSQLITTSDPNGNLVNKYISPKFQFEPSCGQTKFKVREISKNIANGNLIETLGPTNEFNLNFSNDQSFCADFTVTTELEGFNSDNDTFRSKDKLEVTAIGYSVPCNQISSNPRTVQRILIQNL